MTTATHRTNIQPVLSFISEMVVILCCLARKAVKANVCTWRRYFARTYSPQNHLLGRVSFWIPFSVHPTVFVNLSSVRFSIFCAGFTHRLSARFAFIVPFYAGRSFWSMNVFSFIRSITKLTISLTTVLASAIPKEIRNRLNLVTPATLFFIHKNQYNKLTGIYQC
jgi:hypothetical protein